MAYSLTPADLASITDVDLAFGTESLLPPKEEIPEEYFYGNLYTNLVEAIFYNRQLPECSIVMREGFTPENLNRAVRAHLASWGPKHEHKIAGVGYLISKAASLERVPL